MTKVDEALESVLEGYASFLRERMLAPPKHQPRVFLRRLHFFVRHSTQPPVVLPRYTIQIADCRIRFLATIDLYNY